MKEELQLERTWSTRYQDVMDLQLRSSENGHLIYDKGNTADQCRIVNVLGFIEISIFKKTNVDFYFKNQINKNQFQLDCRSKCIR